MVRISFEQKPYRRLMIEYGAASVCPAQAQRPAGRDILAQYPDTPGSLGRRSARRLNKRWKTERQDSLFRWAAF
jgi:tryptophan synthase beta chain